MILRARCLSVVCLCVAAGCQSPGTALFPWTDDSSLPSLTESEMRRTRDSLQVRDEAFADAARSDSSNVEFQTVSAVEDSPAREEKPDSRSEQTTAWLKRGQEAIRRSAVGNEREAMLSEATRSFREVLRIDPKNADAHHGLAIVSDLNEDWALADMSYKHALASRPNDVNLLNDQGYSYLLQSRFHEASQYLNRVLQLSPRHEKAHINLAILDIRRGNSRAALERLTQVFPADQAQAALATLTKEHGTPAPGAPPFGHPAQQHRSQTLVAGPAGPRESAVRQVPVPARHPSSVHGPAGVSQSPVHPTAAHPATAHPTAAHPAAAHPTVARPAAGMQQPIFNEAGVIQPAPQYAAIRPAGAPLPQIQSSPVSTVSMQRPAETPAARGASPLDSARSVGGTFQMPADWSTSRPHQPPSSGAYNPGGAPSAGTVPAQRSASVPLPSGPGRFAHQPVPGAQQGQLAQPGQPWTGQPAQHPHFNGRIPQQFAGQGQLQTGSMQPGGPTGIAMQPAPGVSGSYGTQPSGVSPASRLSADGRPISVYPDSMGLNPAQNPAMSPSPAGAYSPGPAGSPGLPGSPAVQQPGGYPPQAAYSSGANPVISPVSPPGASSGSGSISPAGWAQPVPTAPGQPPVAAPHPFGNPGIPQTPVQTPQASGPAPLAPQYFSSPPVMGHGYSASQNPSVPDPLAEYRATREQLQSEYNQTLQRVAQPAGGTFQ